MTIAGVQITRVRIRRFTWLASPSVLLVDAANPAVIVQKCIGWSRQQIIKWCQFNGVNLEENDGIQS